MFYIIPFLLVGSFLSQLGLFTAKSFDIDTIVRSGLLTQSICQNKVLERDTSRYRLYVANNAYIRGNIFGAQLVLFILILGFSVTFYFTRAEITLLETTNVVIYLCILCFVSLVMLGMYTHLTNYRGLIDTLLKEYSDNIGVLRDSQLFTNLASPTYTAGYSATDSSYTAVLDLRRILIRRVMAEQNLASEVDAEAVLKEFTPLQLIGYINFDFDSPDYKLISSWVCRNNGCAAIEEARRIPKGVWADVRAKIQEAKRQDMHAADPDCASRTCIIRQAEIPALLNSNPDYQNFLRHVKDNDFTIWDVDYITLSTDSFKSRVCCQGSSTISARTPVAKAMNWLVSTQNRNITLPLTFKIVQHYIVSIFAVVALIYPLFHHNYRQSVEMTTIASVFVTLTFILFAYTASLMQDTSV